MRKAQTVSVRPKTIQLARQFLELHATIPDVDDPDSYNLKKNELAVKLARAVLGISDKKPKG